MWGSDQIRTTACSIVLEYYIIVKQHPSISIKPQTLEGTQSYYVSSGLESLQLGLYETSPQYHPQCLALPLTLKDLIWIAL